MRLLLNNPLKVFQLYVEDSDGINVTFKNVIEIFKSLSQKRLRLFSFYLHPTIEKDVTESELKLLHKHFTLFLKNSKLYYLFLVLNVKNKNNNDFLKSFNFIEHYIKNNKKEVEKMEYFVVRIGN